MPRDPLEIRIVFLYLCIFEVRDQKLRVNQFKGRSSLFGNRENMVTTAQCANLVGSEEQICGGQLRSYKLDIMFANFLGVVYTLDRVLLPNPPTILRLVKGKQEFSRFLQLLEFAGMSEEVRQDIGISYQSTGYLFGSCPLILGRVNSCISHLHTNHD